MKVDAKLGEARRCLDEAELRAELANDCLRAAEQRFEDECRRRIGEPPRWGNAALVYNRLVEVGEFLAAAKLAGRFNLHGGKTHAKRMYDWQQREYGNPKEENE